MGPDEKGYINSTGYILLDRDQAQAQIDHLKDAIEAGATSIGLIISNDPKDEALLESIRASYKDTDEFRLPVPLFVYAGPTWVIGFPDPVETMGELLTGRKHVH